MLLESLPLKLLESLPLKQESTVLQELTWRLDCLWRSCILHLVQLKVSAPCEKLVSGHRRPLDIYPYTTHGQGHLPGSHDMVIVQGCRGQHLKGKKANLFYFYNSGGDPKHNMTKKLQIAALQKYQIKNYYNVKVGSNNMLRISGPLVYLQTSEDIP